MGSSGLSYKVSPSQTNRSGPQGKIINKYLRLSGSASETNNANGDYSTNTGSFYVQPPAGEIWRIHRMLVNILNTGSATNIDQYAGIAELANGIQVRVINGGTDDFTDADPITKLTDWAAYCYDLDVKNKVNGGSTCYAGVRWTFANSGQQIRLIGDNNDRFEVTCRDDLTDLTEHRFLIQGYEETDQY